MAIHIVNIRLMPVDKQGNPILKESATIEQIKNQGAHEMRVIPNDNVPNSAGYPTIEDYLILEDSGGLTLRHMDQYTIITQT